MGEKENKWRVGCSGGVIPAGLKLHQVEGLETVPGGQRVLAGLSGSLLCSHQVFTRYGKCYTFNSGRDGRPRLKTMKGGTGNGLEIMLDIQQDEYLPVWGETGMLPLSGGPLSLWLRASASVGGLLGSTVGLRQGVGSPCVLPASCHLHLHSTCLPHSHYPGSHFLAQLLSKVTSHPFPFVATTHSINNSVSSWAACHLSGLRGLGTERRGGEGRKGGGEMESL